MSKEKTKPANVSIVPPPTENPEVSNNTPAPIRMPERLEDLWKYSLHELVLLRNDLADLSQLTEDGEIPDEYIDLFNVVNDVFHGKVDKVAVFAKAVIPAHIEAVKQAAAKQIEVMERLRDKIDNIVIQALNFNGATQLNGEMWRIRKQRNPKPFVMVEDENKVPDKYKRELIEIRCEINDMAEKSYWSQVYDHFKDHKKFKGAFRKEIIKDILRDEFKKETPEQDLSTTVMTFPGGYVKQEYNVRYEEGRAKVGSAKATKKLKKGEETDE